MVAPTIDLVGTNISTAESATGFGAFKISGTGGGPSAALDAENFIQGSNSIATIANKQRVWIYFDIGAGNELDFTSGGANEGELLAMWWNMLTPAVGVNVATGGTVALALGSATPGVSSDRNEWILVATDVSDGYSGGWARTIFDPTVPATTAVGAGLNLASVRYIGWIGDVGATTIRADNLFLDRIDRLTGLRIEDGDSTTPASWQELFDDDFSNANKYGVVDKRGGIFYLRANITIGDGAGTKTTLWEDTSGAVVEFERPQYYTDAGDPADLIPWDYYEIKIEGNGTGTTDVDFGSVVGTGDDRQGINGGVIRTAGLPYRVDAQIDIADLDSVNMYGVSFVGSGVQRYSSSTKTDLIGCTFTDCEEIQPHDAEFLNNTIIAPRGRGLEMEATNNIKQLTFVAGDAGATAAEVGTRSNTSTATNGTTGSLSHTTTSATDVALLVLIGSQGTNIGVESVSFEGVRLTEIYQYYDTGINLAAFILFDPPIVAGTISVTFDGTALNHAITAYNVSNVQKAIPARTYTPSPSRVITNVDAIWATTETLGAEVPMSSSNSWAVGMLYHLATATTTYNGNGTERYDADISTEAHFAVADVDTGTAADFDWTKDTGSSALATVLAIELLPTNTEHMVHLHNVGDASINFVDMQFFGGGAAGEPKWHGENSQSGADVTLNASGTSNSAANEWENTNTTTAGTITYSASVNVTVTVVDGNNSPIQNAQTTVRLASDNSEILNADTNASGIASTTFGGTTPASVLIKVRKNSPSGTRYENFSTTGTIASGTGLSVTVVMTEDGIVT
jgi:hypothetical protein